MRNFTDLYIIILALYLVSEVKSTEDNIIRTEEGVIDLNTRSNRGARDTRDEETHSRTRRTTDLTESEIKSMLDKHNELRSQVNPEASNMMYMEWNDTLAHMAQVWSDSCTFSHGQPTNIDSGFSSVGQNLWLGSGAPNLESVVQSWYNEDQFYSYEHNNCSGVCGHYTQVVWATSYAVGCGVAFCSSTAQGHTNVWIVTCNYGPAGNFQGQRPYLTGPSCTQCESGSGFCYNNQCRDCPDDVECECRQICHNCGTFVESSCSCDCLPYFLGTDCSQSCGNYNDYCGNGWYRPQCESYAYVSEGCPLMCELCEEPGPDFVCNPDDMTTISATTGSTSKQQTSNGLTIISATTDSGSTPAHQTTNECSLDCQNGGECFIENGIEKCNCNYGFSGATCKRIIVACPCE